MFFLCNSNLLAQNVKVLLDLSSVNSTFLTVESLFSSSTHTSRTLSLEKQRRLKINPKPSCVSGLEVFVCFTSCFVKKKTF